MEASWLDVLASTPFKFIIGEERKEIAIHVALVSRYSEPLKAMINGYMSESLEGHAYLSDVDVETFSRIGQWMYTDDYTPATADLIVTSTRITNEPVNGYDQTIRGELNGDYELASEDDSAYEDEELSDDEEVSEDEELSEDEEVSEDEELDEDESTSGDESTIGDESMEDESMGDEELADVLNQRSMTLVPQQIMSLRGSKERIKHFKRSWQSFSGDMTSPPQFNILIADEYEDYEAVLISHAKVYVFADKYCIEKLRQFSLEKLKRSLLEFHLHQKSFQSLTSLVKYTYANTYPHGVDPLRDLVSHYISFIMEYMMKDENFVALLEEIGAFGKDVVRRMMERFEY